MNPWAALLEPTRTRTSAPVRVPGRLPSAPVIHTSDGLKFKCAAAMVVTNERAGLRVELVPVVAVEFRA